MWPGGLGAAPLQSCPAQTQLVAEQSRRGSSSVSSLAGVPGPDSHCQQHLLLHPRGCGSRRPEGLEGWGSCSLGSCSLRSGLGHSAGAALGMLRALCSEDKQRAETSGAVNLSHFPSTELIFLMCF